MVPPPTGRPALRRYLASLSTPVRADGFELPGMGSQPLLPHHLLRPLLLLQRTQKVHEMPRIVALEVVGKRWHRRSIQPGHEDLVEIFIRAAALESRARGEVERLDRLILAVRERRRRWPVAAPFGSMTLPAFHLLEQRAPGENVIGRDGWLGGNADRRPGLLRLPS